MERARILSISRLAKLKEQRAKLEARIQMAEARVKNSERKKDTRRKILIGSYYLDLANKENNMEKLVSGMDKFLVRDNDRALFGLAPKNKKSKPEKK